MRTEGLSSSAGPQRVSPGRRLGYLLCVLAAVGLVRVYLLTHTENVARDSGAYLHMARLLGNETPSVLRKYPYHPAYPALVAAAARVSRSGWPEGWAYAGQIVSVIAGLLAVAAIYAIAEMLFDRRAALLAGLLFGIGPRFSHISADVLSDPTALGFGLSAVALALWARRAMLAGRARAVVPAVLSGLFGGLAYLTRPEYLLTVAIAAAVLIPLRRLHGRALRIQLAAVAALVAAAAVCVLPYAIAIGGLTRKKSLSDFVLGGAGGMPLAAAEATPNLLWALRRTIGRCGRALGPFAVFAAFAAVLTWLGIYVLRLKLPQAVRITPASPGWLVLFAGLVVMVPVVASLEAQLGPRYVSTRHMLLPAGLLAPAAGAGLLILAESARMLLARTALKRAAPAAMAVLLIAAVAASLPHSLRPLHQGKGPHVRAGRTLRELSGGGAYVAAPDPWVPLFADAPAEQFTEGTDMPFHIAEADLADAEALLRRLRRRDPGRRYRYLALDGRLSRLAWDNGIFEELSPRVLVPVVSEGRGREERVTVFRIRPPIGSTRRGHIPPG